MSTARVAREQAAFVASPPDGSAPTPQLQAPTSRFILGMRVDATTYPDASRRILDWAREGRSRYVCVATVNNVMESHDHPSFRRVMNEADLVTADGMPLVWALRLLGVGHAERVYGPELTPVILRRAEADGIPVGFYGGAPAALAELEAWVQSRFPRLQVVYRYSPPFRPLSSEEDERIVAEIAASGARLVLVGLGCPKQERWMAAHRGSVPAVMVGIGAAFDFLTGRKRRAPRLMQRMGLEWLFRMITEPRRLWRRYLHHNPRFLALFGMQVWRSRIPRAGSGPVERKEST
jgi:N-acetylglucosaminyldiphosphoundecaprenol N-acetyl-beta-D-mannosaminyltransferase